MAWSFSDFLLLGDSEGSPKSSPYILLLPQGPRPQQMIESNISVWGTIGGGPVKAPNSSKDEKIEYMWKNTRDYNAFTGEDSNIRINILNAIIGDSSLYSEWKKVHEGKDSEGSSLSPKEEIKHCVHISFDGEKYPFKMRKIVMARSRDELFGKDKSNKDLLRLSCSLVKNNTIFYHLDPVVSQIAPEGPPEKYVDLSPGKPSSISLDDVVMKEEKGIKKLSLYIATGQLMSEWNEVYNSVREEKNKVHCIVCSELSLIVVKKSKDDLLVLDDKSLSISNYLKKIQRGKTRTYNKLIDPGVD